ncbi:MAG: FAD:protein FMN transferase [Polaromonas sp.]
MSSETPALAALGLQRHSLSGQTMGTRYSAVFFAPAGVDEPTIGAGLFAAVDKVDSQMSTWKPDSNLSRLNALPEQQWLALPEELMTVLDTALRIGQQSQGAFDIGVGELVNAWGFGPTGSQADVQQASALGKGPHHPAVDGLEIDRARSRVLKRLPVTLDLSGIAKGYGVDALARCMNSFGITRYLVGIDGEMRAKGLKPDGQAWAVAIEKPVRHVRGVMGVMELSDAAIATSGDYRHWVEVQGQHYSHTMNPLNGQPVRNRLAAVTVVMSSCMLADAWATALLVLGETDGVALAQKRGMDALFVLRDGDGDGFEEISLVGGQRQP